MTNTKKITWTLGNGKTATAVVESTSKAIKHTGHDDWMGDIDMGTSYNTTTTVRVVIDGATVATGNPSTRVAPNNQGIVAVIGGKVGLKQDQYDAIIAAMDETREAVTTDEMKENAAQAVRLAEIDGKVEARRKQIESID